MDSILFLSEYEKRKRKVNDMLFENLNMNKIYDKKILEYMSVINTEEEAKERQNIFRGMFAGTLREQFYSLRTELAQLDTYFHTYDIASNRYEKIFSARLACIQYVHVCKLIDAINFDGVFVKNMKSFADRMNKELHEIEDHVINTSDAFEEIKHIKIKHGAPSQIARSHVIKGYAQTVYELAEMLGSDTEHDKFGKMNLKINDDFANLICALYPENISMLSAFANKYILLLNRDILHYRNEIEFYIKVYEFAEKARRSGISTALSNISHDRVFKAKNAYNVTLIGDGVENIVPNDIDFSEDAKLYFLTGANGGGKTSYLRTVALNLILGISGCPVFCENAEIFMFQNVYTHFPEDEHFTDMGRFAEEKARVNEILSNISESDFVLFNETFSGTSEERGIEETLLTANKIIEIDAYCLFVTHMSSGLPDNVPVLAAQVEGDENKRTFKIIKKNNISKSFADDILKKYGLSKADLQKRFV